MPGRWNPASPPKRPGSYTNYIAKPVARINAPLAGIVAMPVVADWGPTDEVVECNSLGEYRAVFGDTLYTPGHIATYQLFKGEGIANRGGASRALIIRKAGSSAKEASVKLADTKEAPNAEAVIVKGIWKGTLGNRLAVTVEANAIDPSNKYDLVVFLDGAEIERWTYGKTDWAELKAKVAKSDWITVEVKKEEAALALVGTPKALSGGNDGTTLASGDWTDVMSEFGSRRFSVFVPFDLTDETIIASLKAWASDPETGLNSKGKRFEVVTGMNTADLEEALEQSEALNDENFCNWGGFLVQDSEIEDENGNPVNLTPSTFAPRVAGVIAATGGSAAITFSRFADVSLVEGLSDDADFVAASEGGVCTLAEDSNELAPVRVEQDVTTYVDDTEGKPKSIFGKLKFVRTMQAFEMRLTEFAENEEVIGKLGVNDDSREYLVGQARKIVEEFERSGEFFKGDTGTAVYVSLDPPPTPQDNFIPMVYEPVFGRDLEQIRNSVIVS